ncbi:hypothetical protein EES47_19715 [Streptomyces sp. ADI98-12]|nr:hypothetical protein EES47_19715 [Streptomyces sp. ADI98-12]
MCRAGTRLPGSPRPKTAPPPKTGPRPVRPVIHGKEDDPRAVRRTRGHQCQVRQQASARARGKTRTRPATWRSTAGGRRWHAPVRQACPAALDCARSTAPGPSRCRRRPPASPGPPAANTRAREPGSVRGAPASSCSTAHSLRAGPPSGPLEGGAGEGADAGVGCEHRWDERTPTTADRTRTQPRGSGTPGAGGGRAAPPSPPLPHGAPPPPDSPSGPGPNVEAGLGAVPVQGGEGQRDGAACCPARGDPPLNPDTSRTPAQPPASAVPSRRPACLRPVARTGHAHPLGQGLADP